MHKNKEEIPMKKVLIILMAALFLTACTQESAEPVNKPKEEEKTKAKEEPKKETKKESKEEKKKDEGKSEKESTKIDTSVFAYAKKVDVTDAIDINQHVTVFVTMSEELTPVLATQHVLNQSYDFLQQEDIKGAKTVTIAVKQGDIKIAQITVNKDNFVPNDTEPMASVVLKAAEIDMMKPEIKDFINSL
jgi:Ca2+-dependent lipid-binding protein